VALAVACFACAASPAAAHGFGQRFDLPLPLWLWMTGAGATIVLTFGAIALFAGAGSARADYPRIDLMRFAPVRWIARRWIAAFVRLLAVLLFALTIIAGFFGAQNPYANLAPTMVWVVWWVGLAFVCALLGDAWALVNPLRTLFTWSEALRVAWSRGNTSMRAARYPAGWGAWPGVVLFLLFAWAELVWRNNDVPAHLAGAIVAYTLVTWVGMFLFGRDAWLANGEAFSIAFGVLGRFAPLEVPPGSTRSVYLRPLGAGLSAREPVNVSFMTFVVVMLATVTFDGFQETPLMQRIDTAAQDSQMLASLLFGLSEWGFDETQLIHTATLLAFPLIFLAVFLLVSAGMVRAAAAVGESNTQSLRNPGIVETACAFVLTLVPIAVAYHLSHYFSLLLTAGQFIIPLASDPFGFGWDLFGTAKYKPDLAIVSPYVLWYGAVAIIVVGHVIAVFLAHAAALRAFGHRRAALASQVPMVMLMVAYTTLSLWILAQPIVA
jgi:hypothetical protein